MVFVLVFFSLVKLFSFVFLFFFLGSFSWIKAERNQKGSKNTFACWSGETKSQSKEKKEGFQGEKSK
jgi:hypothetical protein